MDEKTFAFGLLTGLIVLFIIASFQLRLFADTGLIGNATEQIEKLAVLYVPGSAGAEDAVKIDRPIRIQHGYHYIIHVEPRLKIVGEGAATVRALVTLKDRKQVKDTSAWAKDLRDDKYAFDIVADEDDYPQLVAEMDSEIPPIQDLAGADLYEGHPMVVKDKRTGAPIIVTAYLGTDWVWRNPLPEELCTAKFELECKDELKYSGLMRGCHPDNTPLDCKQHIDLCGGAADIEMLDLPNCDAGLVRANIEYEGSREFELNELVGLSIWIDDDCTNRATELDPQILDVLCPKHRIGGMFTLKAGLIQ